MDLIILKGTGPPPGRGSSGVTRGYPGFLASPVFRPFFQRSFFIDFWCPKAALASQMTPKAAPEAPKRPPKRRRSVPIDPSKHMVFTAREPHRAPSEVDGHLMFFRLPSRCPLLPPSRPLFTVFDGFGTQTIPQKTGTDLRLSHTFRSKALPGPPGRPQSASGSDF